MKLKKNETEKQYSKKALNRIISLWELVCWAAMIFEICKLSVQLVKCPEYVSASFESILYYVGAPMTGGIIGYLIKSALEENKGKTKKQIDEMVDEITQQADVLQGFIRSGDNSPLISPDLGNNDNENTEGE